MKEPSCERPVCPVNDTIIRVEGILESGQLHHPKSRRIVEEIHRLLKDVAWGRAGDQHPDALKEKIAELRGEELPAAGETAAMLDQVLEDHHEVFVSHIRTHNCATGACTILVPAPCQMACPAGIDVPTYVTLIGLGRDAEAIEVIRKDNPFPWVCGLVCTRPCEFMCVRGRIDTPVSIKFLKAFAAERAMSEATYRNPPQEAPNGKQVCVVGAGPAGLSCAYYLALKGYSVRVIEDLPSAGGMIFVGIPRYRLPREVIDREVAMLEDMGVTFQFNTRFGRDVTYADMVKEGFSAFFIGIGCHKAYELNLPGEKEYGATDAIALLKRAALGDRRRPGRRAVVVGGGNVAIDAARTCLRLGCEEVTIAYRRTRNEMPADHEEVEQAEEEGIHFSFLTIPTEILGDGGRTIGLKCVHARLESRGDGSRMSPVPIEGSEFIIDADLLIAAIGQQVDRRGMAEMASLNWTRRGTIEARIPSMETGMPGVFAAGDVATGPATVIEAIGGGKRAALAIDRYLHGIPHPYMPRVPVRRSRAEQIEVPATTKMILKRPEMPLLNLDRRRTTFQQVELGYAENAAREEARRCLRCDICRRCGECEAICRDKMGIGALKMGYLDFDNPKETDFRVTQELCILCGACAANCPNNAIRIEDRNGERMLTLCGTILNRQKIIHCEVCGTAMGPQRYLDYIRKQTKGVGDALKYRNTCDVCLRKKTATFGMDVMSSI